MRTGNIYIFGAVPTPCWGLLGRDDDHRQQINEDSRYPAGDEGNEHRKAEPEWADAEELAQSAAYPGDDSVVFRSS